VRSIGAANGADVFMGDAMLVASGLGGPATADSDTFLGVLVGAGKNETVQGIMGGEGGFAFNPDDLLPGNRYYDDSVSTHTEWTLFYVPARGSLFKGQADGGETAALLAGTAYDITFGAGNTTTGVSAHEIAGGTTAAAGEGVVIVKQDLRPDNDNSLDNADYVIRFNTVV
jgi:hypothetical protein